MWEGAKPKFVSPKGSVGWIAKPQCEEKSYAFLNDIIVSLLAFNKGDIEIPLLPQKLAAANIVPTPRPPKNDLPETHGSGLIQYYCNSQNDLNSHLYF